MQHGEASLPLLYDSRHLKKYAPTLLEEVEREAGGRVSAIFGTAPEEEEAPEEKKKPKGLSMGMAAMMKGKMRKMRFGEDRSDRVPAMTKA